jgi:hypothetical protein
LNKFSLTYDSISCAHTINDMDVEAAFVLGSRHHQKRIEEYGRSIVENFDSIGKNTGKVDPKGPKSK